MRHAANESGPALGLPMASNALQSPSCSICCLHESSSPESDHLQGSIHAKPKTCCTAKLMCQPAQCACNRMRSSSVIVTVSAVLALLAHHEDLRNAGAEAGMVPEQQHSRAIACSSMGCSHTALLCSGFSANWRNQGGSRPSPAPARLASRLQPAPGGCPNQLGACERCACCAPNLPSSSWIWHCK